jgi:hypothetical protein
MDTRHETPDKVRFSRLPLLVRLAVGLSLSNTRVIFEEVVVDRTGLWALLPGYVRGRFCPWDLAALGAIWVPLLLGKRWRRASVTESG